MTAQEILVRSLDWKAVMVKAGVRFSEQTTRAVNSLVEYLGACAEIESQHAAECDLPECQPGVPYSQDLDDAIRRA